MWPKMCIRDRDKRLILVFLLLLAGMSLLTISAFGSKETISDRENRALSAAPEFSWENLFSGDYLMGWEAVSYTHLDVYKRQVTRVWSCWSSAW